MVVASLSGCGVDEGFVELNWQWVDNRQRKIYPDGYEADVCGLTGTTADGSAKYDLRLRLTISEAECEGGPSDEGCQVMPPQIFSCRRARASITNVPADEDNPYLMSVSVVVDPLEGDETFVPLPTCASVPGPRQRRVLPGGTVDLQVFQMVMNGIDPGADSAAGRRLDLAACNPATAPDPMATDPQAGADDVD